MRIPRDCFANLVAALSHDMPRCECCTSVVRIFTCRELVAKVLNMFKNFMRIFSQKKSQDRRATVVRRSHDVRASVANLSPRNFSEFTMRNFRDTRTNVVRVSHDGCATVLRQHAKNSRLFGEKIKLSDIGTNVVPHSHECRATVVRIKNENKIHSRESRETLSRMSHDCRATVARYIFKIRPKFANLSHKCLFNESAT